MAVSNHNQRVTSSPTLPKNTNTHSIVLTPCAPTQPPNPPKRWHKNPPLPSVSRHPWFCLMLLPSCLLLCALLKQRPRQRFWMSKLLFLVTSLKLQFRFEPPTNQAIVRACVFVCACLFVRVCFCLCVCVFVFARACAFQLCLLCLSFPLPSPFTLSCIDCVVVVGPPVNFFVQDIFQSVSGCFEPPASSKLTGKTNKTLTLLQCLFFFFP